MTDAINSSNRPVSPSTNTRVQADTNAPGKSAQQSAQPGSSAIVELSNPNLLEDIGDQIRNNPDLNNAKVGAIKLAIANGEYQPNPEVIAKKFLEIEKLLP